MERNVLVGGQVIKTHDVDSCLGEYCTIHNNSDHHMVKWKQIWDERNHRIMRVCQHNIAHADPDEINPNIEHHCDGCCSPSSQFSQDFEELVREYIDPPVPAEPAF